METRVKHTNAKKISRKLCPSWEWAFNYDFHGNGRIWVGWNPNLWNLDVLFTSSQVIHCKVQSLDFTSTSFFISFVYGLNSYIERRDLWNELGAVSPSGSWCLMGDFNIIKDLSETNQPDDFWDIGKNDFKECTSSIGIDDLRGIGPLFTWWNNQLSRPVHKKLDRVMGNSAWFSNFDLSLATFAHRGLSDHSLVLLNTGIKFSKPRRHFQFFNHMALLEGFMGAVGSAWNTPIHGNPFYVFSEKLKRTKHALSSLNLTTGNLTSLVKLARDDLHSVQSLLHDHPSDPANLSLEKHCTQRLFQAIDREEVLMQQKSRANWLTLGDRNTAYFANMMKSRWNSNKIFSILNDDGVMVYGKDNVEAVAVDYFKSLFNASDTPYAGFDTFGIFPTNLVSPLQASQLIAPVSDSEIFKVLNSMKRNKSPGPDGFNVNFFLSSWDIVGPDFLKAVHFFFSASRLTKGINSTALALIPKCPNPSSMADFRPISCCNTIYKCIAKIISNRLKEVLPHIIDTAQSAFVKGRSISDNILIAQELFQGYTRTTGPSRCALKIDLRKAFDTVRWDFLFDTLKAFQFPAIFIEWIKACTTSAVFSIKLNGTLAGFFGSSRGLRQGDPLSPFLFVIVMEMLSLHLNKATSATEFTYHWKTEACKLTHLLFADDILIFSHASLPSIAIVNSCILSFSLVSGLIPNTHKSHCYLANTDATSTRNILSLLGFQLGSLPAKFLGVPLLSKKLSYTDCVPLIQRITNRATSWTSKVLAFSGRLQLIHSILFSLQVYWCTHFMLPKAVLRDIQALLGRFLWKGPTLCKYGAKVAWANLTLPKDEGGLGLKNLLDWNKALLLQHFLRLISYQSHSLWANWMKATILKSKTIWQVPISPGCSWIWKQFLKLRPLALQHLKYIVGDGQHISLWYDPWLNGATINPSHSLLSNTGLPPLATVSFLLSGNSWALPVSNHHEVILLRQQICHLPIPSPRPDQVFWGTCNIKTVKAKQIWESIRARSPKVPWSSILWNKFHVPRFSFILWLGLLQKLSTNDRTKHYTGRTWNCPLCNQQLESFNHLFFECDYSSTILQSAVTLGNWTTFPFSWDAIIAYLISYQGSHLSKNILCLTVATCFYKVWEARNNKIHNGSIIPPRILAKDVIHLIKSRLSKCNSFIKATNCNHFCNWLLV